MRLLLVLAMILVAMVVPMTPPAAAQSDAGVLERLMGLALQRPSIAGPLRGELPTDPNAIRQQAARVAVRDSYVAATFNTPDPAVEHPWDVGISLRRSDSGELTLFIGSDGTWSFQEGRQRVIASGPVPNLATGPGEINHIDLVAIGSKGYFAVNGGYVATLDLSPRSTIGDIAVEAAAIAESQRNGAFAAYDGFEVWSLDRTSQAAGMEPGAETLRMLMAEATASAGDAGPFSGELFLEEETIDYSVANVYLRDFYAHAVFTTPYPTVEHPWDIGIGFRDHGIGRALRLVVSSDGEWFLSQGTDPFRVAGQGAQVDPEAGGRNELDLVVKGDTAYLAVNGEYVTTVDVSASDARGDIWVSSGFFAENTRAGAITAYADFRVWSLQSSALEGELVEVVVWGNGEVIFDLPPEDGSSVSGLVSVIANGDATTVEVGVVGTAEEAQVGIHGGTCGDLEPMPTYDLAPVLAETMSSVTTLDIGFEELTGGGHAIAIRAGAANGGSVLACNEIPTRGAGATG